MATRCATEVTVVDQTDATAVRCWYQLSASATLPAKPTTTDASATPSGWTRSEPTISSAADAAKYVYACWQTVWGDGTCDWGDVSMSASFEAAKTAYNLASSANATATTTQQNLNATRTWYAECPTAAATAAKVATITPATTDFSLAVGTVVAVKFDYANSVAAPTLNVNGTGAKDIKRYGTTAPSTSAASSWNAGNVVTLVYDGTYWQMTNWLNNNDNYYDRENYKAALAASTAIAAGRVAALGTDNKLKILAANSAFDISGPILYVATAYSAANVTAAATRATNYTFWGTPFALTNTHAITGAAAGKPVYIVGTLSGNMFTPSNDVFTCTTPTSADNLVYMRLGIMSTAANAVLESQHPLYMYFNGAFQQCDKSTADAAKTATNYIGIDTDGIKIADANPSSATTYLHLASSFLDFIRGGVSMLRAGIDDSIASVRIGMANAFNTFIDGEGIKLRNGTEIIGQFSGDEVELAKNNDDAVIRMLDGTVTISANKWDQGDDVALISAYMTSSTGIIEFPERYVVEGSDITNDTFDFINAGQAGDIVSDESGQREYGYDSILCLGAIEYVPTGSGDTEPRIFSYLKSTMDSYTGVFSKNAEVIVESLFGKSVIHNLATHIGLGENSDAEKQFPISSVINAIPVTLYDNASASASATATLSETAANFRRMTIFFKDSDGNHSSTEVWSPNGKRVSLSLTWINGASSQEMYQRVRWVAISGTTISTYKASSDAKYRTGQVKLGATASVANSDYIAITHVIGYR